MILLLASRTDPLRHLLSAALEATSPGQAEPLLSLDPDAPGDLALKLSAGDGLIDGRLRTATKTYDWSAVRAAWISARTPPEPGSAYELLLEGLDLAAFPVVGRPRVRESLACDSSLDELAKRAGLGRPDRSWLAASHGQDEASEAEPEPTVSLWRGGRELHGTPPSLRPWIPAITRFADAAELLWGRIELRPQLAAPPHVLRVVQEHLPISSFADLPEARRQALLALGEYLGQARARSAEPSRS